MNCPDLTLSTIFAEIGGRAADVISGSVPRLELAKDEELIGLAMAGDTTVAAEAPVLEVMRGMEPTVEDTASGDVREPPIEECKSERASEVIM